MLISGKKLNMLELKKVNAFYDNIHALVDVSFSVNAGDMVSIIGSNGAGKTTLLQTISGFITQKRGSITLEGNEITALAPEEIVNLGISQVLQGRQLFPPLSVMDNLTLGAYIHYKKRNQNDIQDNIHFIFELFPVLSERKGQLAGTLSGGEQQMLAIGRALMAKPKLLLLDEPSLGLAPLVAREIFRTLIDIHSKGTTIILVEQNARAALQITNYGYVLENGKIALTGKTSDLLQNETVKKLYLGG